MGQRDATRARVTRRVTSGLSEPLWSTMVPRCLQVGTRCVQVEDPVAMKQHLPRLSNTRPIRCRSCCRFMTVKVCLQSVLPQKHPLLQPSSQKLQIQSALPCGRKPAVQHHLHAVPDVADGLPIPQLDPFIAPVRPCSGILGCVGAPHEDWIRMIGGDRLQRVTHDSPSAAGISPLDFESLWPSIPQAPLPDTTPWIPVSHSLRKVREFMHWTAHAWAWISWIVIALRLAHRGLPVHIAFASRSARVDSLLSMILSCGGVQGVQGWVSVRVT